MAWAGEGAEQLLAILESESSEEEEDGEEEEDEEDEEAAAVPQRPLGQDMGEAEKQLAELEQASQALLAELSALETECEIERACRQRAEAYAAQVKQENKQLKRLSLAPPAPPALPEPPEEDPDHAQRDGEQLKALQQKLSWLLAQRRDLTVQLQDLQRHNQDLQDQLEQGQVERQRLRAALAASQRALRSVKRVSRIVTQDYCEAVQQLELEQDLRLHAEAFAHEMLVQKKEASRQSTILLQSAEPSGRLLAALQEVGRLSRELEEQRQRVTELEEQLGGRPELQELELARAALAAAEAEKLELGKRLRDAERQLAGLGGAGSLQEKPAQDAPPQTPEPTVPPPPPPLPPPTPAIPTDPLSAIRQRKGLAGTQHSKPDADDAKAQAVQEMMERIKKGVVLRPAKERGSPGQGLAASKRRSAVLELQSILGAVRRGSRRRSQRPGSPKDRDRQLEAILQRRRQALDVPAPVSLTPGPPPRDQEDTGAAGRTGDKDIGSAPSGCSLDHGDSVPFRPRAAGGLPRTRPLVRLARDSGDAG